jgi:hypothetical protein
MNLLFNNNVATIMTFEIIYSQTDLERGPCTGGGEKIVDWEGGHKNGWGDMSPQSIY